MRCLFCAAAAALIGVVAGYCWHTDGLPIGEAILFGVRVLTPIGFAVGVIWDISEFLS